MIVIVSGTLYRKCEDNSHEMWANQKKGEYGKGCVNSKADPRKVERVGRLGECAYGLVFDKEPDWSYRQGGDDYDFLLGPFHVDVKTSTSPTATKTYLKYSAKSGRPLPIKCDIYVGAQLLEEDPELGYAKVKLCGWLHRNELDACPIRPGVRGFEKGKFGWQNYDLEFELLHDIEDLIIIQDVLEPAEKIKEE